MTKEQKDKAEIERARKKKDRDISNHVYRKAMGVRMLLHEDSYRVRIVANALIDLMRTSFDNRKSYDRAREAIQALMQLNTPRFRKPKTGERA